MPDSGSVPSIMDCMARMQAELPPALAKVGEWALAYPFRTATLKMGELASAAEVSIASVNRYARALGFAGYPDFRAELLRAFEATFSPVDKLRASAGREATHAQVIRETLVTAAANIERTLEWLQPELCEEAVSLIQTARRVFVTGLGGSAYTAAYLADTLEPYIDIVRECTGFAGSERVSRRLLTVTDSDLVIGISVPRYSRRTIDVIHLAKERGARVIALTDAPTSPMVPLADVALLAGVSHPFLHCSHIGIFGLIEGFRAALARTAGPDAIGLSNEIAAESCSSPYTDNPPLPPGSKRRL